MTCRRCPHHVRHGQASPDGKSIVFKDVCGLVLRQLRKDDDSNIKKAQEILIAPEDLICKHYPFPQIFDYADCAIYKEYFKGVGHKNDVIPTKDFQYSDVFSAGSITDMELL